MIEISSQVDVDYPAEEIFDLIIAFNAQGNWLSKSLSFRGTVDVSPGPITLGTTYREPGLFGVRRGTVVQFDRPTEIAFHQPMKMRFGGTIDVMVQYELTPADTSTRVQRAVTLQISWPLKAAQSLIVRAFRAKVNEPCSLSSDTPTGWV